MRFFGTTAVIFALANRGLTANSDYYTREKSGAQQQKIVKNFNAISYIHVVSKIILLTDVERQNTSFNSSLSYFFARSQA